jgi:CRP-like cAMP-binding protein
VKLGTLMELPSPLCGLAIFEYSLQSNCVLDRFFFGLDYFAFVAKVGPNDHSLFCFRFFQQTKRGEANYSHTFSSKEKVSHMMLSRNHSPSVNPSPSASLSAPPPGGGDQMASSVVKPKHSMNTLVTAISAFLHTPNTVQLHPQKSPQSLSIESGTANRRRGSNNSKEQHPQDAPAAGTISPSSPGLMGDQRELIREMFDGIDKKSRGWISVSATRRALSSFGVRLDHTDMEELLREVSSLRSTSSTSTSATSNAIISSQSKDDVSPAPPTAFQQSDEPGKNAFDLSGFGYPQDEDDDELDFADLHSGGVGYHSSEVLSTGSNDAALKSSMTNLPYRQRQRDQQQLKGESLFKILQRVLSASGGGWHPSGAHDVPPPKRQNDQREVDSQPRVIAVGPSSSEGAAATTTNLNDDETNDIKPMISFRRGSTTASIAQKMLDLAPRSHSRGVGGASGTGTPGQGGSLGSTASAIKVTFEMFHQMVMVWQTAARFRQFEERTYIAKEHLDNGVRTIHFLPDSLGMFSWHCFMMTISTFMIFAALSVFSYQEKHLPRYLSMTAPFELVATILYAVDIYFQFHTVVISQGPNGEHMIDDTPLGIAKAYLHSPWLFVDLFCVLPLRFCFFTFGSFDAAYLLTYDADGMILTGYEGCVNCSDHIDEMRTRLVLAKIFMVFRCVKYFEHLLYFHESRLVLMNTNYVTRNFVFVPMFTALSNIVVTIQTLATVYLSKHPRTDAEVSYGGGLVLSRAYYLVLACFATVGYGDVVPEFEDEWDRGFFILLIAVAFIVNASVIGEAVSFFQRSDIDSRKSESLLELLAMCKYFCIPSGLRNEIVSFYNHNVSSDIMNSYGHKFEMIPVELRKGLQLMSRLRLIRQLPYFDDLHRSARLLLCNCLEKSTYCPEQYVIYAGEIGNEMFFLNHGFVDIFGAKGLYLVTLRHGNYFGEMAIIDPEPQKRAADVKAITYCEIYVLSKESFQDLLEKYPRLHSAVTDLADKRRKQTQLATKQATATNDVPPPPVAPEVSNAAPQAKPKPRMSLVKQINAANRDREMTIVVNGVGVSPRAAVTTTTAAAKRSGTNRFTFVEDFSDHDGDGHQPLPAGTAAFDGGRGTSPRGAAVFDRTLGFAPLERHDSDPRDGTIAQRSGVVARASSVVAATAATPRNLGGVFGAGSGAALRTRSNSVLATGGPPPLGAVGAGGSGGRPQLWIEQSILNANDDTSPAGVVPLSDRTPGSDQRMIASLIDALEDEIGQLMSFLEDDEVH